LAAGSGARRTEEGWTVINVLQTEGLPLNISDTINRIKKRTNSTWAIHAEVPAIPVNPNIPAIMATIRKTIA
jgi:hypothetical protein